MLNLVKKILLNILIFSIFGAVYCGIEIAYRGRTHISMFFVGGLCGLLVGIINEITPTMSMLKQCFCGAIIITFIEFISGCIINIALGLNVWDYSNLPLNILGQVSLIFSFAWFVLSYFAIKIDDYIRHGIN